MQLDHATIVTPTSTPPTSTPREVSSSVLPGIEFLTVPHHAQL
jgi:hypothetical protein